MKKYDIFISYRREGGLETADSIYQRLYNAGYSVFLDLEQLNSGKFNEKLLSVIDQCTDFILVLPPNALDRCDNEDDWVRRELEHAISKGKNIIPIMLRGFDWPDTEKIPETIRELPNYNAITASDHNVFVENIERLKKSFLRSKPGFSWQRYKKTILITICILATFVGLMFLKDSKSKDNFDRINQEYAMQMMTEFTKAHENYAIYETLIRDWETFVSECEKGRQSEAREAFITSVDYWKSKLYQPAEILFSEEYFQELRDKKVAVEDFQAFYMACEVEYENILSEFDKLIKYSAIANNPTTNDAIKILHDFYFQSLKTNYYCLLCLYSEMNLTQDAWDKLGTAISNLNYLADVPFNLPSQQYEVMINAIIKDMEVKRNKLEWITLDLEKELKQLDQIDTNFQDSIAQVESISRLATETIAKTIEYSQIELELAEKYKNALANYSLKESDDQGTMWGKILRMATYANISRQRESEEMADYNKLVAEAKKKGVNPESIRKPEYLIPSSEKYNVVIQMLTQYQNYNPANESTISRYVSSAKLYYANVSKGKILSDIGILVMGTSDNKSHPAYEVGDIIIERNGLPIHNINDYIASGKDVAQSDVVVLRNNGSDLKKTSISFSSDCPVSIGAFELHES